MNRLFLDNSIGEIVNRIKCKQISPNDIAVATLENIEELNPRYFAWVVYNNEEYFDEIIKAERKYSSAPRLLENIPVGVKDVFNTVDFPTQMGSPLWKDFTSGNDARAVFNIKRQGAVVIGKTVTAEFAVHALGKTINPYDAKKTPGTSSSGSAVAITLGMVPMATGTQTAGSIVRPASFCGIYGCKPSFGLIPRTGTLKTTDSLDTIGFFVIHQKDLRRGFDSLRVSGSDYPFSYAALSDVNRQHKPDGRPWRVGFVHTHTWKYAPSYARESLENFMRKLSAEKNIEIVNADLPMSMERSHDIHEIIYNKILSYYFAGEYKQSDLISPIMNELIRKGKEIEITEFVEALQAQTNLIYEMDSFFKDFDVLISLSTAGEAPLRDVMELPDPALMWTMTHLPAVSVPVFKSPSGMPFGMQVVSRKYNDYLLFEFLDYMQSLELIPVKAGYSLC